MLLNSSSPGIIDLRRAAPAVAVLTGALVLLLALAPASRAAQCPDIISPAQFAGKTQLHRMVAKFNSFGPRMVGSASHNKAINWLEQQSRAIGLKTHSRYYKFPGWYPKTRFKNRPGLDISSAARLNVTRADGSTVAIPDAGAIRFSEPTSRKGSSGQLVYLPKDEAITPENAAGKVIIREYEIGSIPFGLLKPLLGIYNTPDLDDYTTYTRPYLSPNMESDQWDAGLAGAAGIIYTFDLPQKDVRGYYDPHNGTIYRQPGLFVGRAQGEQLKSLAAEGATARLNVDATIERRKTRNLFATLPGQSKEKMILIANTDGNTWVQENGVIGMLAFARYYSKLPMRCRPRTLQLVFSTAHDATVNDGLLPKNYKVDRKNTAFVFTIEHLGTREILPVGEGADTHLEFTGLTDPALFGAGDSEALRTAAVDAATRRHPARTGVLKGLGIPNPNQAPSVCSMGGLGSFFQSQLVPTLAMISGPWSLYDPVFGAKALDFGHMRTQMLMAADAILALDGLPRADIEGDYPALRAEVKAGTKTPCSTYEGPQYAPGPG